MFRQEYPNLFYQSILMCNKFWMDINSERRCLFISSLKTDIHLYKFISYVINITQQIRYKVIRLMLFGKIIQIYCENRKKRITTLCEENGEFLNVEAGGTDSNSGANESVARIITSYFKYL